MEVISFFKAPTDKKYKVRYGTYWDITTPIDVIDVLHEAEENNTRIHISLGNTDKDDGTLGRDWLEEYGCCGYIGRSTGTIKVPLLIHNKRSLGGPHLLDHRIVRIRESRGGRVLWQHRSYHIENN